MNNLTVLTELVLRNPQKTIDEIADYIVAKKNLPPCCLEALVEEMALVKKALWQHGG